MRQSLSLGFLLTLLCLNMYVNSFCSLDNPGNFRKDDFANQGKIQDMDSEPPVTITALPPHG